MGKWHRRSDYARSAAAKERSILITFGDGKTANPSPNLIRNRAFPIDLRDCSDPVTAPEPHLRVEGERREQRERRRREARMSRVRGASSRSASPLTTL